MSAFGQPCIDADLHAGAPSIDALLPYLSDHWREYIRTSAFKGVVDSAYPPLAPTTVAPNAAAPSSLQVIQEQVLDAWDVEVGILNCAYSVDSLHNPDTAAAMASAVNDWLAAEWLAPEPRLRGSLVVPTRVPEMGAREMRLVCRPGGRIIFLNHFLSPNPLLSRTERLISPFTIHIGFKADLDLPAFLAQADLQPVSIEKVNIPRIWSLVTCVKD